MLAALLLAGPAAAMPDPFDGIPNVTIVSYPVRGRDLASIEGSLATVEPVDRNDGAHVEGGTRWRFAWQWPQTPGGGCRLDQAQVRFSATVTLPRLVGLATLPPDLQAYWQRNLQALAAHEAAHVRYAHDHRGEVLAAIRGATCATAQRAGQAMLRRLVAHDREFDRTTDHGRLPAPAGGDNRAAGGPLPG